MSIIEEGIKDLNGLLVTIASTVSSTSKQLQLLAIRIKSFIASGQLVVNGKKINNLNELIQEKEAFQKLLKPKWIDQWLAQEAGNYLLFLEGNNPSFGNQRVYKFLHPNLELYSNVLVEGLKEGNKKPTKKKVETFLASTEYKNQMVAKFKSHLTSLIGSRKDIDCKATKTEMEHQKDRRLNSEISRWNKTLFNSLNALLDNQSKENSEVGSIEPAGKDDNKKTFNEWLEDYKLEGQRRVRMFRKRGDIDQKTSDTYQLVFSKIK